MHEQPDGCFFDQPDASLIRHDGPWRSDAYEFYARQMFEPAPLPQIPCALSGQCYHACDTGLMPTVVGLPKLQPASTAE